jgi:acetyl-CoA C-acetyltransferase
MVDACRQDPGSVGLVSAIGWYVTKHSIGLYSTTPPKHGLTRVDPAHTQAEVDALPRRDPASAYEGSATVEATAVVVERDGTPTLAIASTLTPDGRRALANTRDSDAMTDMTEKAWEGRTVKLRTDGTVNVLD